jgi:CDP-6-deoxy-D-xylo-4-hexulose-3-dehydrase
MGEGGAVVTNGPQLKVLAESFRDWGRDCWCAPGKENTCGKRFGWQFGKLPFGYDHKYIYSHVGYNLKVTDMQAAVGVEQLKKVQGFVEKRRENFAYLLRRLGEYDDAFIMPRQLAKAKPSPFGFPLTVRKNAGFTRNEITAHLEKANIATRLLFAGNLTKQPAYEGVEFRVAGGLENADAVMNSTFWVGVYPGITRQMLEYMCESFDAFMKARRK